MRRRVESATEDEVTARDGINGLGCFGASGRLSLAVYAVHAFTFAANTAGNCWLLVQAKRR